MKDRKENHAPQIWEISTFQGTKDQYRAKKFKQQRNKDHGQ